MQQRGKFLEDGHTRIIQNDIQEEKLRDTIENEVNELTSVLDEMQSITGSEIFVDLKKMNLQKCQIALKKDIKAIPRKTHSQDSFSSKTLKFAKLQL